MVEASVFLPRVHEIYRHFKGNLYQITAIAEHTETGETLVVYQAMYGEFKTYARPLAMFIGRVDREKYPEVTQEFRFELQGPEAQRQRAALGSTAVSETGEADACHAPGAEQGQSFGTQEQPSVATEKAKSDDRPVTPTQCAAEEEVQLDPGLVAFLDADSYEEKLNILAGLRHRITNDMLTIMAISCDIEVEDGEIETRYSELRSCLLTLQKYECKRLR